MAEGRGGEEGGTGHIRGLSGVSAAAHFALSYLSSIVLQKRLDILPTAAATTTATCVSGEGEERGRRVKERGVQRPVW
jgi:hypothetical protein